MPEPTETDEELRRTLAASLDVPASMLITSPEASTRSAAEAAVMRSTAARRASDVRVSEAADRVMRALAEYAKACPELTSEEILVALMREASDVARALRTARITPVGS
ncbi:hypothetical protein AB0A95_33925 [Micromonospora sp. NPDC049230]|uniref:hypothetical protein n=1 Tax=Micromonospora sp. NPDC049230 TaxID=3155502 RepID=UPI0033C20D59